MEATSDPEAHLTLGTRSDNMLDRAMKGRLSSVTALRWRRLTRAERAAQSRALRDELTQRGWDHDVIRELVHGIDHPSRSVLTRREDDGGGLAGGGQLLLTFGTQLKRHGIIVGGPVRCAVGVTV